MPKGRHEATTSKETTSGDHAGKGTAKDTGYVGKHRERDGRETER